MTAAKAFTADLFGDALTAKPTTHNFPEAAALRDVLRELNQSTLKEKL